FDRDLLLWELEHFKEWLLLADRQAQLTVDDEAQLRSGFAAIAGELAESPRCFVHRDYQSRNLMIQEGRGLRLLDFQDALLGTRAYDLVALLRDSYVELDAELLDDLITDYVRQAEMGVPVTFRRL